MANDTNDEVERHVVIIRGRKASAEDGHHGGAWKIAYADFMTAMMAFFLVMWLINVSDEKTIEQVAAYFNPMKLSDKSPSRKGVHDGSNVIDPNVQEPDAKDSGDKKSKPTPAPKGKSATASSASAFEDKLLASPAATLSKIAASLDADYFVAANAAEGASRAGRRGDEHAPRDPFEPPAATGIEFEFGETKQPPARSARLEAIEPTAGKHATPKLMDKPEGPPSRNTDDDRQKRQVDAIRQEIERLVAGIRGKHPAINVEATPEGLLISLMDNQTFGMFANGSSEPRAETVVLMQEIGKILTGHPGDIIVRGHTDARPYRSGEYDNWRLSSARSHTARQMLVRGGLDHMRVIRVEGHADRSLRIASDGLAAANRRIDILLRPDPRP